MSSIAYVTDRKMIDYHRLCGNTTMNFWRLSAGKEFTDFHRGDLLFFYTRMSGRTREKGFVGYAHFESAHPLSLRQMWKRYGTLNGYYTQDELAEAIRRASKNDEIPEKMNTLFLKDVVFFNEPVIPEEIGILITPKLESYQYIDKDDPQATVRILKKAEEGGIDSWSAAQTQTGSDVFRCDEIRQQLAVIHQGIQPAAGTSLEKRTRRKLAREKVQQPGWELIRDSAEDAVNLGPDSITLCIPFVYNTKDYSERLQEVMGRLVMYRLMMKRDQIHAGQIHILLNTDRQLPAQVRGLIDGLNHDGL